MELLLPVGAALLGSILASFIGVLAERINTGETWVKGRSHCNSCGIELVAADLVPIASWLSTGGRAGCCGARLPMTYLAVEIGLAVAFYFAAALLGFSLLLPLFLFALSILAFIVLYDLRHTVVPMPAALLFVATTLFYSYLSTGGGEVFAVSLITAGVIGLGFFLLYVLSRGRAMGLGDSPIALGLALLVGHAAVSGLLFSFWIGALCGIAILVGKPKGHRMGIEVPFVPFLAVGFLLAYFTQWTPFLF